MTQPAEIAEGLDLPTEPPAVELEGVTKEFGDVVAVDDVSLSIEENTFFALLGPSGCGKTTTLRMIGGFEEPTAGTIRLHGENVTGLKPYRLKVNTVFQSYALFPHLTIFENVAFGLRRRNVGKGEVSGRVSGMLDLVQLTGMETRKPRQLSGGQQQRVALARALINSPRVLLLDEPLGALDLKLRKEMQIELKRIQHEVGITFIHVTHDQEEAMTMADSIAVMHEGRIKRLGNPTEIYDDPQSAFVANFLGASNMLAATILNRADGAVSLRSDVHLRVPAESLPSDATEVQIGVRPEKIMVHREGDSSTPINVIDGTVIDASFIGVSTHYIIKADVGQEMTAVAQNVDPVRFRPGDRVSLAWHPEHVFVVSDERSGTDARRAVDGNDN